MVWSRRRVSEIFEDVQSCGQIKLYFIGLDFEEVIFLISVSLAFLTKLLSLILIRLPEIRDEIDKSIIQARNALNGLPKPPSDDPRGDISFLLHTFTSDLAQEIKGVPDEDGLIQAIRPAQEKFRRAIRMTAPDFCPFERKFEGTRLFGHPTFLRSEEEDEGKWYESESASSMLGQSRSENFATARECCDDDDVEESATPYESRTSREGASSKTIYIDEVMKRAQQ